MIDILRKFQEETFSLRLSKIQLLLESLVHKFLQLLEVQSPLLWLPICIIRLGGEKTQQPFESYNSAYKLVDYFLALVHYPEKRHSVTLSILDKVNFHSRSIVVSIYLKPLVTPKD